MATGYGVCFHIVYEHRAISCMGNRGQVGPMPYGGCFEIVRKSCDFSAVVVHSQQPPHGNRTEPEQFPYSLCGDSAVTAPFFRVRVPKVHNFTFLLVLSVGKFEMTPKTKGGKRKRSK